MKPNLTFISQSLLLAWGVSFAQEPASLYRVSDYAGVPRPAAGDTTLAALFLSSPFGVGLDAEFNLYIADYGNHQIRRVTPEGKVSTLAGTGTAGFAGDRGPGTAAQIQFPRSLAIDVPRGLLYFSEQSGHRVRQVDLKTGIITTVAGDGTARFNGDNQPGPATSLNEILGLAVNAAGDLFIVDTNNHRIRKLTFSNKLISTVAGAGTAGFSGDGGPATAAQLNRPSAIAVAVDGAIYFYDINNRRIRKVFNNTITTLAGGGSLAEGPGSQVNMGSCTGMTAEPSGASLLFTDETSHRLRRVRLADGVVSLVAGTGAPAFSGDSSAAIRAGLNTPTNVTANPQGIIYVADTRNNRIRRIDASGIITTAAGGASKWGAADVPRAEAMFDAPTRVSIDPDGLLVVDYNNCAVRLVGSERVTYLAGAVDSCRFPGVNAAIRDSNRNLFYATSTGLFHKPAASAAGISRINQPSFGMTLNLAGTSLLWSNLDATQRIGRVQSAPAAALAGSGLVVPTTVAGSTLGSLGDGGPATAALVAPYNLGFDSKGNLFVSQTLAGLGIRKIGTDGIISTHLPIFQLFGQFSGINGMAVEPDGAAWISTTNHVLLRLAPDGQSFTHFLGDVEGKSGYSNAGLGKFKDPLGLALDKDGTLYVADSGNHLIRKIVPVVARVEVISGNNQTGAPGSQLPLPIRLRVMGDDGAPFAKTQIAIFVAPVTGVIPDLVLMTDDNGIAELKDLVLPEAPGEVKFEATLNPGTLPALITYSAINRLVSVTGTDGEQPEITLNTIAVATGVDFTTETLEVGEADMVDGQLPTNFGGVCVDVGGGLLAPISKVSPNAVTFLMQSVEPGDVPVKVLLRCGKPDQEATNVVAAKVVAPSE